MPLDTAALWELASLREQGVLTEEEFQAEKAKILHQQSVRGEGAGSATDAEHRQGNQVWSSNKAGAVRTSWQEPPENRSAAALLLEESHRQGQSNPSHRDHAVYNREQYEPRAPRHHDQWHQGETQGKAAKYHTLDRNLREQERRKQEQERSRQEEERLRLEVQLRQHKREEIYKKQEEQRRELAREEMFLKQEEHRRKLAEKLSREEDLKRREKAATLARQKAPPMVTVPISPDEMGVPGGKSSGTAPPSTGRLARSSAQAPPRSRSFDRASNRAASPGGEFYSPPRRSATPTPRSASPTRRSVAEKPTEAIPISNAPGHHTGFRIPGNQTQRKAEGQLRFDAQLASRHVHRQLMRVEQLIPIAQEAAVQAGYASDVAFCAKSVNAKSLRANSTRANENLQRTSVRRTLEGLDETGKKCAKMMQQRTAELKETEVNLQLSLAWLKELQRSPSSGERKPATSLTTGTLASPNKSHIYKGNPASIPRSPLVHRAAGADGGGSESWPDGDVLKSMADEAAEHWPDGDVLMSMANEAA